METFTSNMVVKYKELRLPHSAYGDAFLHPSFSHSHINQYGRLFTSSPRITLPHLESIKGGNLHDLTMMTWLFSKFKHVLAFFMAFLLDRSVMSEFLQIVMMWSLMLAITRVAV